MSFRLGTLLLLASGCATATVVRDENAERIDSVIRAQDPIPEPLAIGEHEPLATGAYSSSVTRNRHAATVSIGPIGLPPEKTPVTPVGLPEAPEGYRYVTGRYGPKLMRQPGYIGVEIGEIHTGK